MSVRLLSERAETCYQESVSSKKGPKGFWAGLKTLFGTTKGNRCLSLPSVEGLKCADLESKGYQPFCQVRDVAMWIREEADVCHLVFSRDGEIWDISEWNETGMLGARVVAEFYFMVIKDDFQIDAEERKVLQAVTSLLQITTDQVEAAKALVFWSLVDSVCEDDVVTDEENEQMAKIIKALEISAQEQMDLSVRMVKEKFDGILQDAPPRDIVEVRVNKIRNMAKMLGVADNVVEKEQESLLRALP